MKKELIPDKQISKLKKLGFNKRSRKWDDILKWFREEHKLKGDVKHAESNGGYTYTIWKWNFDNSIGKWERIGVINSWFKYEEAQLACLIKLIEIAQQLKIK
jgi:hypothetical protein